MRPKFSEASWTTTGQEMSEDPRPISARTISTTGAKDALGAAQGETCRRGRRPRPVEAVFNLLRQS